MVMNVETFIKFMGDNSPVNCHPTGSRFFLGRTGVEVDYDYVVSASNAGWSSVLRNNGFHKRFEDYAAIMDDDTAAIWERTYPSGEKIQVVASRDYTRKIRIIAWLKAKPELVKAYYTVPKELRGNIWKRLHKHAVDGNI